MRLLLSLAMVGSLIAAATGVDDLVAAHKSVNAERTFDPSASRDRAAVGTTGHGITEIEILRSHKGGMRSAPWHHASLSADGTARWSSGSHPEREGIYEGTVSVRQFNELAWFIHNSGYFDLEHTYITNTDHHPVVITSVMHTAGRTVIKNSGSAGPTDLWAVEMLIDAVLDRAEWTRKGRYER